MDEAGFAALALALTLVGGTYTYVAYQRRGVAAGLRGAALTLLPLAAYLTDTLRMFTRIGSAVGDWATGLVFSPAVWIGVILAGMSVLLLGASRVIEGRGSDGEASEGPEGLEASAKAKKPQKPNAPRQAPKALEKSSAPADDGLDDEMAEIQAILRKRGIS